MQDRVPVVSAETVRNRVPKEYGNPAEERVDKCRLESFCCTITHRGFFRSDTHPGNFLVKDAKPGDPDLPATFIGCAGLPLHEAAHQEFRVGVVGIINGDLSHWPSQITDALWIPGYRTKQYTQDSLEAWVNYYGVEVTDPIVRHFNERLSVIDHVPAEYVMLDRAPAPRPEWFQHKKESGRLPGLPLSFLCL